MTGTSILVVDDDLDQIAMAETQLSKDRHLHVVGHATSSLVAYEQVRLLHPDIVLVDRDMSGSGVGAVGLTRCLKAQPNPPLVVLLTGEATQDVWDEAASAGADALVPHDSLATELLPMIHKLHPHNAGAPAITREPRAT
jgi:two-component system chemotaxis response regulator CheB